MAILGANLANPDWDGSPETLAVHDSAAMPQTTNGSMILAFQNLAATNSAGTLAISSGGQQPEFFNAPANAGAPTILVRNWRANNLQLTNVSAYADTPIRIQAYGPGMPGQRTKPLPADTNPIPVSLGDTLEGSAQGGYMQLIFEYNSNQLALFALIGGPQDAAGNNAFVFAVNFSQPPSTPLPAGYTATTAGNSLTYQFNWATRIFVAYFGGAQLAVSNLQVTPQPTVTLLSL